MRYLRGGLVVLGVALVAGAARPAAAGYLRGAEARSAHGRVSAVNGDLLVKGPDDSDWSYVERNATVHDDDLVRTDEDTTAEIEMERGTWLRLGPDSDVAVRRLPPGGELRLKRGSIYVDLSDDADEGLQVQTPAGDVDVEPGSLARIDIEKHDEVRVMIRRGRAGAELDHGASRHGRAGDVLLMDPEEGRLRVAGIEKDDFDAFDDWSDDRVAYYLDHHLPRGVDHYVPGVYELADYGEWVQVDGAVAWRPLHVAAEWRPYQDGYWSYWHGEPLWIGHEPWGYTTCHYGRWRWTVALGWVWAPGYVWGPAYVQWARHDDYVVWTPLDPWDRPCVRVVEARPAVSVGIFFDIHTSCCMPFDNFRRHDRTQVVVVENAPRTVINNVTVNNVTVIKQTNIYQGLPADCRYRGQRTTTLVNMPASQRVQTLAARPERTDWRVRQVRTTPAPGAPPERWQARPEARAQVRRQVTVPNVPVRSSGPSTPTAIRHGGEEPRREERPAARDERPGNVGSPRRDEHPQASEKPATGREEPRRYPARREDDARPSDRQRPDDHATPRTDRGDDGARDPYLRRRDSGSAGRAEDSHASRDAGPGRYGQPSRGDASPGRDSRARDPRRDSKDRRGGKGDKRKEDDKRKEGEGR